MSTTAEAPKKHHWFRFSLRTLLVFVAIASIVIAWITYQLKWKQQRYDFVVKHQTGKLIMHTTAEAPWSLKIFGEEPAEFLLNVPAAHIEEARRLFPEAKINPKPSDFPPPSPTTR